jgi:two-component system sensor histidine kinase DesK
MMDSVAAVSGAVNNAPPEGRPAALRTTPMADQVTGRWRFVWLWGGIWLVYLLEPLGRAAKQPDVVHRGLGVASVALFAVAFVIGVARVRTLRREIRVVPAWLRYGTVSLMLALTLLTSWAIGRDAMGMLVYVAVIGLFMLPARPALALVAVLLAATIVVPALVPGWNIDYGATFGVFVGAVAMWGILQIVQRNSQLAAAREEMARLAVVDERARFARDLHDILGHSLTVVAVKAELAGRLIAIDPARAETEIADVQRLARQALTDVRAAVSGIREVTLAGELATARGALRAAGIEADLPAALESVPAEHRELFGWVVREGITNVIRHSRATACRITVSANDIEVEDNGDGPVEANAGGHGLTGLRERVTAAGGALTTRRGPGGGFALRVHLE